jgi:uncharacterized membrane protein required for colicin V production
MYWAIFGAVMFAGFAMTVREGLWSNTLTLLNIIVSGLVAFGFYSQLVVYLDEEVTDGQHTYWLDFAVIWALFCVAMILMRTLTGAASKTRMRFKHPIDAVGGPIVGLLVAYVLTSFTLATLHTSPMPKDAFGGKLVHDGTFNFAAPDTAWIRFAEFMMYPDTLGYGSKENFGRYFIKTYSDHREKFDKAPALINKRTKSS